MILDIERKTDCITAALKSHEDPEAFILIEQLITRYFTMLEHMKETSLYDVYMYEERLAKSILEPMEMFVHENSQLKKEINQLRRQLGLCKKYKEPEEKTLKRRKML